MNKSICNCKFVYLSFLLFGIEVLIALFIHDHFIRPFVGDFLVVIFIFCFLKIFWKAKTWIIALSVLVFSYCIEILQSIGLIQLFNLEKNKLAIHILGNSFQPWDLVAYTLGIFLVILVSYFSKAKVV